MINRRRWLAVVGMTIIGGTPVAQEKAGSQRRVGVLAPSTFANEEATLKPFFDRMREFGWLEGRNIAYDRVYANDRHEELPSLARQLAARKPDQI
jgi:putative ABC transport system substrate-binding protein